MSMHPQEPPCIPEGTCRVARAAFPNGTLCLHIADELLPDTLLQRLRGQGLVKAKGRQRTDSTHVLANVRGLNRLERVGETLRAALNELAVVAPDWLQVLAPPVWYERYSCRVENYRLPKSETARLEL